MLIEPVGEESCIVFGETDLAQDVCDHGEAPVGHVVRRTVRAMGVRLWFMSVGAGLGLALQACSGSGKFHEGPFAYVVPANYELAANWAHAEKNVIVPVGVRATNSRLAVVDFAAVPAVGSPESMWTRNWYEILYHGVADGIVAKDRGFAVRVSDGRGGWAAVNEPFISRRLAEMRVDGVDEVLLLDFGQARIEGTQGFTLHVFPVLCLLSRPLRHEETVQVEVSERRLRQLGTWYGAGKAVLTVSGPGVETTTGR